MNKAKWKRGTVKEFLGLTFWEVIRIEIRILIDKLFRKRKK